MRERAIALRKHGFSYSEILKQVRVAKSTLSLWFKEVTLSKSQKQALTQKKLDAAKMGGIKKKQQRLDRSSQIRQLAKRDVGVVNERTIRLLGAFLYWAEGNKQKEHAVSVGVKFSNSDPTMIRFFYEWLRRICCVATEDIHFELYIHESGDVKKAKEYWERIIPVSGNKLLPVRWKRNKVNTCRKNIGKDYFGLIRINVRRSTDLNRKIMAWVWEACRRFLVNYSGVV